MWECGCLSGTLAFQYERRETARKVREVRAVCTDLTEDEAAVALRECRDRCAAKDRETWCSAVGSRSLSS